jgi:radical SAM superfamily enzyme YgiQ (UPF0313 family)
MAKILFVEEKLRTDKLGILYLSKMLKDAGHEVDMIQDEIDSADTYLLQNDVDFVMYSVMTGSHRWFIDKNRDLKSKFDFKSVFGGPHFTFFPEEVIGDESIDHCVQGPAEEIIVDLVEGRIKDKIIKGHLPLDVDEIPAPDRSILYKYDEFGKSPMKRFMAGRDCPHSCKYCFNHLYHDLYSDEKKKFFQITSPDKMIDEILEVKEKYGLRLVYFNDDDFARNKKWLEEFCEKFKSRVNLPFCGSIRADSVDDHYLELLADTGCTFMNIALESANPDTQKLLRRGNIKNEQIAYACVKAENLGIKIRLQNMIGLPVEDPLEDALETLSFNQSLNISDSWVAIFQPFPKTDLWKYCVEKDLIDKDTECNNFYEDTVLRIPDADKINRLHRWWYFAIKYKLPIDLIRILLKQPFTKEINEELQDFRWKVGAKNLYGI